MPAVPHLLGHTCCARPAVPHLLGHTCWATPAGPPLLHHPRWATLAFWLGAGVAGRGGGSFGNPLNGTRLMDIGSFAVEWGLDVVRSFARRGEHYDDHVTPLVAGDCCRQLRNIMRAVSGRQRKWFAFRASLYENAQPPHSRITTCESARNFALQTTNNEKAEPDKRK